MTALSSQVRERLLDTVFGIGSSASRPELGSDETLSCLLGIIDGLETYQRKPDANVKRVVRLRYGLEDDRFHAYKEIAEALGISEVVVRNREAAALRAVRREWEKRRKPDAQDVVSVPVSDVQAQRLALGMTQAEFAEALGVNRRTLEGWESGRHGGRPLPKVILKAIERLKIDAMRQEHIGAIQDAYGTMEHDADKPDAEPISDYVTAFVAEMNAIDQMLAAIHNRYEESATLHLRVENLDYGDATEADI